MTKSKELRKSNTSLHIIIIVLAVIANSGYYLAVVNDSYIPLTLLIVATVYLIIKEKKKYLYFNKPYFFILLIGIFLSSIYNFNYDNFLSGGRVVVTMICAFIIVQTLDMDLFLQCFCKIIRISIYISVAFYFFIFINGNPNFPLIIRSTSYLPISYYNLILLTQEVGGTRLSGWCWEPGVFSSIISFAMIYELYFKKDKIRISNLLVYIVAIFLTKSTAGIIILVGILVGFIWNKSGLNRYLITNIAFVIIVVTVIFSYEMIFEWLSTLNPEIFYKLTGTSQTTNTRIYGPLVNLRIFSKQPILGFGFTGAASQYYDYITTNTGAMIVAQTSTSTQILSSIGISGIMYTIGFIEPLWRKNFSFISFASKIVVASVFLLTINKEPHVYIVITWIIFFYLTNQQKEDKKIKS